MTKEALGMIETRGLIANIEAADAMVKAAKRVVVVCDSTKFHRRSLARIIPPASVDCVITDRGLSESDAETLRGQDIELILV